ncbi:glutathione binding-like protein [Roseovarius sp. CAU 1744]|uniref:glutathione binding-like protein n=1 Tax=Roseovarius sp. CAU 1744 TaxID=3140368 RepID=UPI00325BC285
MHLFYKPGACSMAAHIILNEVDVAHTVEKVDTEKGVTETGLTYAEVNPRGYVPALRLEGGEVITENAAVLQYLGDQFGEHLLVPAAGTIDRVRLQETLSFLSAELHNAFGPFFSGKDMSEGQKQAATDKVKRKIAQFGAMLPQETPFVLGDRFTVADAYAFVILNWANFTGISLASWPRLEAYMARIGARPAVQKTLKQEGLAA